jgi:hypothetical protein
MSYSLGKQVHQSVNEGFEIIENAGTHKLKDPDFRVFLGNRYNMSFCGKKDRYN